MTKRSRTIKLAYSAWPTGRHASAWRLPEAFNGGTVDPVYLTDTARSAERGLFDYYFMGNAISSTPDAQTIWHNDVFKLEGFTVASYVAAVTRNIGLVVTVNSSYQDPFDTARAIVSLDHLSHGRAGLNIVTGIEGIDAPAQNYGQVRHISGADKYRKADEFISVINALSDSWEDGNFRDDRPGGVFIDVSRAHTIDFKGDFFSVRGPLNLPRPPQGQIPIVHAGGSESSFIYGGHYADIRFSPFVSTEWNIEYYAKAKSYLAPFGRDPDDLYVIPGITFYVGGTDGEARQKFREVQDLVVTDYAPAQLTTVLKRDLSKVDRKERVIDVLSESDFEQNKWLKTAFAAFGGDRISFLDLYHYVANRGHLNQPPVVGSGKTVARWIADQFDARALDGVKLFPPYSRGPLDAFVDLVVPELQRLGVYKTSYEAATLRGHLDLPKPPNRYTSSASAAAAE